jgi:hypothetical protein
MPAEVSRNYRKKQKRAYPMEAHPPIPTPALSIARPGCRIEFDTVISDRPVVVVDHVALVVDRLDVAGRGH